MSNVPSMISHPTTTTSVPITRTFSVFLKDREGCEAMQIIEGSRGVEMRVSDQTVNITHDEGVSVDPILQALRTKFYEHNMNKSVRVTTLHQTCAHGQSAQLSVPQASIVAFFSHAIIRESGIADIVVDSIGNVAWFGPLDCVSHARHIMNLLFARHLGGDDGRGLQSDYHNENSPLTPSYSAHGAFDSPHHYSTSHSDVMHTPNFFTHSYMPQDRHHTMHVSDGMDVSMLRMMRKRERLTFMVRSTDAPRLIGTRGMNKRRIEESTQCSITLHTESKKDGEFPVEIVSSTLRQCELAKQHIETFLASPANNGEEEKKMKERPKIHLAFSPKKNSSNSSSSVASTAAASISNTQTRTE